MSDALCGLRRFAGGIVTASTTVRILQWKPGDVVVSALTTTMNDVFVL